MSEREIQLKSERMPRSFTYAWYLYSTCVCHVVHSLTHDRVVKHKGAERRLMLKDREGSLKNLLPHPLIASLQATAPRVAEKKVPVSFSLFFFGSSWSQVVLWVPITCRGIGRMLIISNFAL
jgi:hypothetical protein